MTAALVLASGSEVRSSLLRAAGVEHLVDAARIDEDSTRRQLAHKVSGAAKIAGELAVAKAVAVSSRHPGALVIGADQILAQGGEMFAKPATQADARAQLRRLAGKTHELHSAVAAVRDGREMWRHVEIARMQMRALSDAFLDGYFAAVGDSVVGCVGGYRLEGEGAQLFERVEGDYFTVLGLPLLSLLGFLRRERVLPA